MQWFLGPCSKMILRRLTSGPGYFLPGEPQVLWIRKQAHKAHRSSSYNIHDASNQKFKETMHLVPPAPFVLTSYSFAKNWPSWLLCPDQTHLDHTSNTFWIFLIWTCLLVLRRWLEANCFMLEIASLASSRIWTSCRSLAFSARTSVFYKVLRIGDMPNTVYIQICR